MTEPIVKPGEEYTTRGCETGLPSCPARIYVNNTGGRYPIHGAVFLSGEWRVRAWTKEGRGNVNAVTSYDLMPPKPKPREVWIWVWDKAGLRTGHFKTAEAATYGHNPDKGQAVKFRAVLEDD